MFNIVLIQLAPTNFGGYAFFLKKKEKKVIFKTAVRAGIII